jgi:NADH-quinone oxidoreductase subunit C
MAEEKSSFDSVAQGPASSQDVDAPPATSTITSADHPSIPALETQFGDAILDTDLVAGDQYVVFIPPEKNFEVLSWLKDDPDQRYDLLRDVTAVDFGGGRPLQIVYQLFSLPFKRALRVKCELPLDALEIESVYSLWKAANWLEREVFDLFGVTFTNHPDLRRILMPEDYDEGHPLRKDFPLRGRFSRAEQTRRALSQDLEHYYISQELELGGESQALPSAAKPALPAADPEVEVEEGAAE